MARVKTNFTVSFKNLETDNSENGQSTLKSKYRHYYVEVDEDRWVGSQTNKAQILIDFVEHFENRKFSLTDRVIVCNWKTEGENAIYPASSVRAKALVNQIESPKDFIWELRREASKDNEDEER